MLMARIQRLWALERFRPDIALSRDESSYFLPWIIALMVYLAALTLAGGLTLNRTVSATRATQDDTFSVHLPYKAEQPDELVQKVLTLLRKTPGVAKADSLDSARIKPLVAPWLGKSTSLDNLPLPVIIEVEMTEDAKVDIDALTARLQAIAPGTDVDDHKQWAHQFSDFVYKIQWMLFAVSLVILSTTAAVVVFASKMSLKIHRGTVNLLHRLGAYDVYIANQFQHHAALLTLKGAFMGSGLAAGTLIILHIMASSINSPLFPSFAMTFPHWGILFALPFCMSVIALVSTRISVLRTLMRMP
jgi:cell division transport system permease protein